MLATFLSPFVHKVLAHKGLQSHNMFIVIRLIKLALFHVNYLGEHSQKLPISLLSSFMAGKKKLVGNTAVLQCNDINLLFYN